MLNQRHDHDGGMGDMDMGSMGTADGVPGYFYMQKQLWIVIGSIIAFATLINILNFLLLRQRLRSTNAKPMSPFWRSYATATAITRELSQSSFPSFNVGRFIVRSPQLGRTSMVMSWFITILVFCFYKYDTFDQWSWEDIAYRCGCIAQAQLPLVFLLAGKQNIIGVLTSTSYERLNWLHRWVARILWATVTIHMSFWFRSWARYNYIIVKLKTDSMTQTGFAAWCILTAILLTSFYPMRRLSYEVFVILHLIFFSGLIGAIYLHSDYGFGYVWACVGIFFIDRLLRILVASWANLPFLHGRSGLWANQATLTPLPGNVTRISIDRPVISWKPGQHMFLSCHSVVPLQSHPFTASSLPSDGKLEFLVQAQTGGTRRFHRWASKYHSLPSFESGASTEKKYVGIEGPYGAIRPLHQFDSVVFFAGSTGASFTTPLMRDIVRRWQHRQSRMVTKTVKFVWVIKAKDRLCWFEEQIQQAIQDAADVHAANSELELDISIYVTCDEKLEHTAVDSACSLPAHGEALLALTPSSDSVDDEKKELDGQIATEREVSESSGSESGCQPGGGCCCKKAVDEDGIQAPCCCRREVTSSSSSSTSEKAAASKSQPLKLHTGRPKVRPIIRKTLEEAEGESAVVVCGPQGLLDEVRRSVVYLSDERAVHKGTGAQGVYLHVEGFSY